MTTAISCNVCHMPLAPRFETVVDPQTRESFAIAACTGCGLGHTTPQPDDLGRYYGPRYHGGRHGFTARYCAARRLGMVKSAAGESRGRRLLDVGCGDGTFLEAAASRHGWTVGGVELNPREAKAKGLDVRESIDEISELGPFGCVTLWHSLEHFRDPQGALAALSALLEPGGVLVAAVPDAGGMQARAFGSMWVHLDVPRHLFHFTRQSLRLAMETAGLVPEREWHQEFEYDLFGWAQSALNKVMRTPNVLTNQLTGKASAFTPLERRAGMAAGAVLAALLLPAVPAGTLLGRGGTLVIAARRAALSGTPARASNGG